MDVCKCTVPSRHGDTLNSRRTASLLVRLVEGEERGEAPNHPPGVLPQNWGGNEPNRTVTCMVLKATANDRRHLALCHDEFRVPRSGFCRSGGISSNNNIKYNNCEILFFYVIDTFFKTLHPQIRSLTLCNKTPSLSKTNLQMLPIRKVDFRKNLVGCTVILLDRGGRNSIY
ncbi:uncharacterized protein TNCV_2931711 [Trichonephila clavipes]|nr:uncharacterized protein TNCV_2931711 [Trichonephila clavipes]